MSERTICTTVCMNSSTMPMTRLNLNGQMIGFQADSPEVSSTRYASVKYSHSPQVSHSSIGTRNA